MNNKVRYNCLDNSSNPKGVLYAIGNSFPHCYLRLPFIKRQALFLLLVLSSLVTFNCEREDDNEGSNFGSGSTLGGESAIPRISITADDFDFTYLTREEYVSGQIEIEEWGGHEAFLKDVEIRGRGNSTWNFPKKPFQIRFESKEEVLGMPKDKKWVFLANYTDKSMLRNELGFALGELSTLEWTPKNQFVDLYLNDSYNGTYQVSQKVEESSNRVDIGDDGFLLEIDQISRLDPDDVFVRNVNYLFNIKEPSISFDSEPYLFIQDYVRQMEEAIWSENFMHPEEGYRKYLDIDSVVDWYLVNEIARNTDSKFVTSVFMYMRQGEKMKMGPLWDFDIAFGNVDYNVNHQTDGFYLNDGGWLLRFFQDPVFVEKVKSRFLHFYEHKEELINAIQERADLLEGSQQQNYEKWETLGVYVWPNYAYFDTYEEEVDYLVNWVDDRFEWLYVAFEAL